MNRFPVMMAPVGWGEFPTIFLSVTSGMPHILTLLSNLAEVFVHTHPTPRIVLGITSLDFMGTTA